MKNFFSLLAVLFLASVGGACGDACTTCKTLVDAMVAELQDYENQTQIEQTVLAGCSLLPVDWQQECYSNIRAQFPQINELIHRVDAPALLCGHAGICSEPVDVANGYSISRCSSCSSLVRVGASWVDSNTTGEQIFRVFDDYCEGSPGNDSKASCSSFVQRHAPKLVRLLLKRERPDTICKKARLCTSLMERVALPAPDFYPLEVQAKTPNQCYVCKKVVAVVDWDVRSGLTKDQIIQKSDKVCRGMSTYVRSLCRTFAVESLPRAIDMVMNKVPVKTVCESLHMCTSALLVQELSGKDNSSSSSNHTQHDPICLFVASVVVDYLGGNATDNSTSQRTLDALEDACSVLPEADQIACHPFVRKSGAELVPLLLLKGEEPEAVCQQVTRPVSVELREEVVAALGSLPTGAEARSGYQCYVCKVVVGYVEKFVQSGSTKDEILQKADKVCRVLPSFVRGICGSFVAKNLPQAIDMVLKKAPLQSVCDSLQMCPAFQFLELAQQGNHSLICGLCQFAVSTMRFQLDKNVTEAEMLVLGENVCGLLPAVYVDSCRDLVGRGLPFALRYIAKMEHKGEQVACAKVKLCPFPQKFDLGGKITKN